MARRRRNRRRWGTAGVVVLAAYARRLAAVRDQRVTARDGAAECDPAAATEHDRATQPDAGPSGTPTLRLSWSGQPRDGATATVTAPGSAQGPACRSCPANRTPIVRMRPTRPSRLTVPARSASSVTARLVIKDAYGDSFMCAQKCQFVAVFGSGHVRRRRRPTFDLVTLPPSREKCSEPRLAAHLPRAGLEHVRQPVCCLPRTEHRNKPLLGVRGREVGLDQQLPMPKVGWVG